MEGNRPARPSVLWRNREGPASLSESSNHKALAGTLCGVRRVPSRPVSMYRHDFQRTEEDLLDDKRSCTSPRQVALDSSPSFSPSPLRGRLESSRPQRPPPRGSVEPVYAPTLNTFPDELLDQPLVICTLKSPSWFLSIGEYASTVVTYKGNQVSSHQGAFWKITRAENEKYFMAPVFQSEYYCTLSTKDELIVDNFEKGYWDIKFLQSEGYFVIKPSNRDDLYLAVTDKGDVKARRSKNKLSSVDARRSFFICPVSRIAKRVFFDYVVHMKSETKENIPERFNLDWMKKIPDSTYLTQLWIPGTHDTGSYPGHSFKMVETLARTQSFTITNQLKAGIRFFDIRLRHYRDQLLVHHGQVYCNECWGGVLNKIVEFLKENPSECVITKIQQEYTPHGNIFSTWGGLVEEGLEAVPAEMKWTESRIPTLGEARGRVVMTTWHPSLNPEYPDLGFIPWGGMSKEDEKFYIQDAFFGPAINKKWKLMLELWLRAYSYQIEVATCPPFFFVNHASATRVVTYQLNNLGPKKYAKQVHSRLLPSVLMGPHAPQIFLMDFPSVDLIEAIFERNYSQELVHN
eukprot:TRINITY_DN8362_c0_g1_i1.p1 TRINITY_DN8362_c0_g1~~TRINITY_DN8362_c0_g1_i1.p1  ORF type:complete len:574 (-),score=97.44 TRINITY_DN8362_c0_g1_i1:182-1903(-)